MMKLYYSAGSCSMSCHITLEESGLPYEAIEIDFDNANDPNVALVEKLNPLGTLPILILDNGKQLDQNLAIHTYVAELAQSQGKTLIPTSGTERALAMNALTFVATDLHKGIGALFSVKAMSNDAAVQSAIRAGFMKTAEQYLSYLNTVLAGKDYLAGSQFTVADAYAFTVVGWTKWLEIPLTPYANVEKYMAKVGARPAVQRVLKAEGLI